MLMIQCTWAARSERRREPGRQDGNNEVRCSVSTCSHLNQLHNTADLPGVAAAGLLNELLD